MTYCLNDFELSILLGFASMGVMILGSLGIMVVMFKYLAWKGRKNARMGKE